MDERYPAAHDFLHHWRNVGLRVISLESYRNAQVPRGMVRRAARSHWCLHLMLEGSASLRLPQGDLTLSGVSASLSRPDEGYHQSLQAHKGRLWWVIADFEMLTFPGWQDPLRRLQQPSQIDIQDAHVCQQLSQMALQLPLAGEMEQRFLLRPLLEQFLGLIFIYGFKSGQLQLSSGTMPRWLVDLRHQLGQPSVLHNPELNLSSISQLAGIGASTLGHAFKRHTGLAPMAWVRRERLTNACRLLRNGDERSIEDIAKACGYRSLPLFSRHFRNLMGCSASQWRRASIEGRTAAATEAEEAVD